MKCDAAVHFAQYFENIPIHFWWQCSVGRQTYSSHLRLTAPCAGSFRFFLQIVKVLYLWLLMMTSSNGNIFRVTGHLSGEFTGPGEFPTQRPVTRSFDVFFDLHPNKRLSKQWWGWWFETLSCPFWRHRNDYHKLNLFCNLGQWVKSLGPSDAIWRWRPWSTLVQVMACYLNQCWLIIGKVLWHSSEDIIIRKLEDTNQ